MRKNLSIFPADVGSIKNDNYGGAVKYAVGKILADSCIVSFIKTITNEIKDGHKIALGFECPLFVPMRDDPVSVNSARVGKGNRSWSAGAGAAALAIGLVEVLWVMNEIHKTLGYAPNSEINWNSYSQYRIHFFVGGIC